MATPVPSDLEDALADDPTARESFWAMPPEQKDAWIAWVDRARLPRARRRRVAAAARRLSGANAVREPRVAPPREDPWAWLVGLALLAGLAAFLVWLTVYHGRHHDTASASPAAAKVAVPKVVGIRYQAARFQLREAKLASTLTRKASAKPKGMVLGQAPKAGGAVRRGAVVTLVVSTGPPSVALPDLVGLSAADATKALRTRKLTPVLRHARAKATPGTVYAQKPKAGTNVKRGARVVLQIAQAQAAAVPNVTGQSAQQALTTLQQAGFKATTRQVPSSQPKGSVVAQHPAAGEKLAKGSAVLVNVSSGAPQATTQAQTTTPAPAPAPKTGNDYTGMRLSQAVQQLATGRQQAFVVYVTSSRPAGVVVANVRAGSRERLEVSAGPSAGTPTRVPDVSGEDAATAQQDLQNAGFTVLRVSWPVGDASENGVVVAETPAGGGQVPTGATVVVYVGNATG
jgi:beta-lactam-binding protein with PASTA domain